MEHQFACTHLREGVTAVEGRAEGHVVTVGINRDTGDTVSIQIIRYVSGDTRAVDNLAGIASSRTELNMGTLSTAEHRGGRAED